jgi:putative copper export protein
MIGGATWILWIHILAAAVWIGGAAGILFAVLPAGAEPAVGRRLHAVTSRAMEILVVSGVLNILIRGMQQGASFSAPFFAMLSVKMALLAGMAGLQIWMGLAWRRCEAPGQLPVNQIRTGQVLVVLLGAVAVLLGLGLRAV